MAPLFAFGLTACGDFGDTNIDGEHLNSENVPYEMLFSSAQHQVLGSDWDLWRTGCIYSAQWTQQLSSIGWWNNYARYQWNEGYSASFFNTFSGDRGALRNVTTCYDLWKDNADMQIDWNIARVLRVYAFAKMSDLYGDIPYSEAGRPEQFSYPKYDTQEAMYKSMLAELDEAQANLSSGTAAMKSQDLYYNGDASKWKKLANSLMLRLAMRLVKVDAATAKTYAAKAVANGVFTSNSDNCLLNHSGAAVTNDSSEPFAKIISNEDREFYMGKTFVDMLKSTNDPRLGLICTVAPTENGKLYTNIEKSNGTWGAADYGNMSFASQRGMPVGGYSDNKESQYFVGQVDASFNTQSFLENYGAYFSSPNRCTYADPTGPTFVVTYAQTCLLMAEAAQRGYISGSAANYYKAGVTAAFEQFSQFPAYAAALTALNSDATVGISGGTLAAYATAYLAANPFNAARALEQINTQYYITTFGDPHEVFANWRRSGYPALTPAAMAALDGQSATVNNEIPRRFRYPTREEKINTTNYNEAISRSTYSHGDSFSSRVWWDKE